MTYTALKQKRQTEKLLNTRNRIISVIYLPLSFFYLEVLTRALTFGSDKTGAVKAYVFIAAFMISAGSLLGAPITARLMSIRAKARRRGVSVNLKKFLSPPLVAISAALILLGLALMAFRVSFFKLIFTAAFSCAVGIAASKSKSRLFTPTGILLYILSVVGLTSLVNCGMSLGQLLSVLLLSTSAGLALTLALSFCPSKKSFRVISAILLSVCTLIFCIQKVVYSAFSSYFGLDAVGAANNLGDFSSQAVTAIIGSLPAILLLTLPTVLFIMLFSKYTAPREKSLSARLKLACGMFVPFIIMSVAISASKGESGLLYIYNHPEVNQTSKAFGVLTSTRLEIETLIFGKKKVYLSQAVSPDDIVNPFEQGNSSGGGNSTPDNPNNPDDPNNPDIPTEYGYNITDIDFDSLIAKETKAVAEAKTKKEKELHNTILSMHKYYSSLTPTKQNKYTGMFEGKNLIFMTLEGFSGKVISPELTPNLYKMSTQGFVFNNFYCSMWGGSTATGEYTNMTGLFYNKASCLATSAENYMPLSLGNMFKSSGYAPYAFHANTANYYHRDESHPNMGFEYLAKGMGIEELTGREGNKLNVKAWPQSDKELADVTVDTYINSEKPFVAYYMTISGHGYYTFEGNAMSRKHRAEVEGNDSIPDSLKPYFACQLEVEDMITALMEYLEQAGMLEDTVFVLSTDHYPYMLDEAQLSALYGISEEGILKNYELYKNSLIIWSASMTEPVIVDTPCSSIDIIPTVYNLFGLEYDSRLLSGTDIMSDTDPLVIMNCVSGPYWGFVNRYGSYSTSDGFTPAEGYTADADSISKYVKSIRSVVTSRKNYTFSILENDYYSYVYGLK